MNYLQVSKAGFRHTFNPQIFMGCWLENIQSPDLNQGVNVNKTNKIELT